MRIRARLGFLLLAAVMGTSACSGGSSPSTSIVPTSNTNPAGSGNGGSGSGTGTTTPSSSSSSTTYSLGSTSSTQTLPSVGGFSGTITFPGLTGSNASLQVTATTTAPAGAPNVQSAVRQPKSGTTQIFYYLDFSSPVSFTLPGFPGLAITLPSNLIPGRQFFYAYTDPNGPTSGALAQYRTEGPATVSGNVVTFAPVTTPLPIVAGKHYIFAFYSEMSLQTAIQHVVVIYQENWSFDGLYGSFPGANNLSNAGPRIAQVDKLGNPITLTPQPLNNGAADNRFPPGNGQPPLPVAPFNAMTYIQPGDITGDIIHRFYHEQLQIDGGKMDKFMTWSDNPGLVESYFDATNLPEGKLAQQYTMADNTFHSAFGGSFLNHMWLICACSPVFPGAPPSLISNPDPNNLNDAAVTPDFYVVNTSFTVNNPHPSTANPATLVPNQTLPTIGDRLNDANVSWAWYSGGWNNALAGHPDPLFQFHHQPFAFFANYADGTLQKATHLKDESDFFQAISANTLPAVSFVKPLGPDNEHPGYASLLQGQNHVASIVTAIQNSPAWANTAIIVTYDENGGRWDHVSPPVIDRWGPGTRVPAIIISPYAKRGYVDHTQYETDSILKLIEDRWNLKPLNSRDANANGFTNAFDFSGQRQTVTIRRR